MKKENIFIFLVVVAVSVFFVFVWLHEKNLQDSANREIADCARVVSSAVWNYDDKLPLEYLSLTSRKNNFNKISIIMREGGTFIELDNQLSSPIDKFLISLDFTYHLTLMSEINYNGETIAYVKAEWYPLAIYTNIIFLVFITLCLIIIWYYLKFKDAASNLELRVAERTKELIKSNKELEDEINKRETIERELIKSKKKSEEMNKLKSSLLTNMSHEIRTPMNGILGLASILNENLKEKIYADMAQKIYQSGVRLMNTLGSILALSELESNTMKIRPEKFNIARHIKDLLKQYRELAIDKNLYFKFDIFNEDRCAHIDKKICEYIILNIVDNAIKYTEKGGINISVQYEESYKKSWIVVSVSDTGIGIADKDKEIIFEEFRQLSEGFSRNYEGAGLGLTLVKKMLGIAKGELQLESTPGIGSNFIVKFPAAEGTELSKTEKIDSDELSAVEAEIKKENMLDFSLTPKVSVLLVEDNPVNREVTEIFLKEICDIESVANGKKAIEKAKLKKYSVVLMDINLGYGLDGVSTAAEIKKIDDYMETVFVALTGYAMSADKDSLLAEGFEFYLAKPFEKEELINLVKRAIDRSIIHRN